MIKTSFSHGTETWKAESHISCNIAFFKDLARETETHFSSVILYLQITGRFYKNEIFVKSNGRLNSNRPTSD